MPTEHIIANLKTIIHDICTFKPSNYGKELLQRGCSGYSKQKWEMGVLHCIVIKLPLCSQGISEISAPPREKLVLLLVWVFLNSLAKGVKKE